MNIKQLWLLVAGLVMLNCITVAFFLSKSKTTWNTKLGEEVVATVGDKEVTRQEWLMELEARYGKDVLRDLVDQQVIEEIADKYDIKVSEKEIERELKMVQTMYASAEHENADDEKKWKRKIKNSILLEELLTKDVAVSEKEIAKYYEENKDLFRVPTSYHLSHLIVKTKSEAKQATKELSQGSSFAALAMEKSIEEFSANQGGEIGFVNADDERYPAEYIEAAKKLKAGKWSEPLKVEQGYAIIKLHEKVDGQEYEFKEVKNQIRRQLALEQMKSPVTARTFWDEAKVDWFYGKKE
ncbi:MULTISPECIES: peptidyl-prolyl cis-trans isomerase [unclassified Bacillus (in: firmicutes)]|uniref:peptidyl-prolyl cis-trans isomerase n=1 Tax=unclassified Bacillus (in: firmicutes) TaxID=185979 RepID=UPI0008E8C813|nr:MULTISPECIES: peptidyl-prolyl cis-trans isomerase [unclassified Bacillus (in: firmicutes)]SFB22976.1 foldase protein PrsA [Bacillus sp. UNCCL13]SFQ91142.1 foldase protein PrsA [Bacillus sp. cl95]